jgi:hypothetical protein
MHLKRALEKLNLEYPHDVATHYFIKVARTTMGLEWR